MVSTAFLRSACTNPLRPMRSGCSCCVTVIGGRGFGWDVDDVLDRFQNPDRLLTTGCLDYFRINSAFRLLAMVL